MQGAGSTELERRARIHHALGDTQRLMIVDELWLGDRTPSELSELIGMASNHLAFHLRVLDDANIIIRGPSEGDGRRRYVRLTDRDDVPPPPRRIDVQAPVFVCTRNAARSRLAAALWQRHTGGAARSAGHRPASAVDPGAIDVARRRRLPLTTEPPRGYADLGGQPPDLVVSVCDRANEAVVPFDAPRLHWSIPDPAGADDRFDVVFTDLERRIGRLAHAAGLRDSQGAATRWPSRTKG